MARIGIKPFINNKRATHNKGGHLDQVWTNLQVSEASKLIKSGK